MNKYLSLLLISGICFGQSKFQIKPKYSHLKLINKWVFQSMETITYNNKEEREVVLKDQYNTETLSFHRSGSMTFETLNTGEITKGRGYLNAGLRWSATNSLMLEVNVNDITKNNQSNDSMNREVKIIYFENF